MDYLDAIWPILPVIAYVLAGAKNARRDTVPGAARRAIVRWLDSLSEKSPLLILDTVKKTA